MGGVAHAVRSTLPADRAWGGAVRRTASGLGGDRIPSVGVLAVAMLAVAVPALAKRHGISAPKALWLAVLNPLVIMHFVAARTTTP